MPSGVWGVRWVRGMYARRLLQLVRRLPDVHLRPLGSTCACVSCHRGCVWVAVLLVGLDCQHSNELWGDAMSHGLERPLARGAHLLRRRHYRAGHRLHCALLPLGHLRTLARPPATTRAAARPAGRPRQDPHHRLQAPDGPPPRTLTGAVLGCACGSRLRESSSGRRRPPCRPRRCGHGGRGWARWGGRRAGHVVLHLPGGFRGR